ncbi:fuscose transport/metabolism protein [Citrobacter koseri]|uniref:Fuscose transport/metabolism protein n=1 Tax=Citrobacter koseri TaxID=545 RepID=A0A2X2WGK3_CITKO|nr:fuscose transport/metabolism protein [Citrobacter koseri]
MMAAVEGDSLDPTVEARYRDALSLQTPCPEIVRIDRYAFYERAQKSLLRSLSQESARSTGIFF